MTTIIVYTRSRLLWLILNVVDIRRVLPVRLRKFSTTHVGGRNTSGFVGVKNLAVEIDLGGVIRERVCSCVSSAEH